MLYSNTFNNCNKISGSPCLEIQTSDCYIYENNFITINFKVGLDKLYVMKNIEEFIRSR